MVKVRRCAVKAPAQTGARPAHTLLAAARDRNSKGNGIMRTTVSEEFVRYLEHLAGRVERAARSIPQNKLYFKPFRFGNSIGHLILHLTGNLNHYIGAGIAGSD